VTEAALAAVMLQTAPIATARVVSQENRREIRVRFNGGRAS
jgi:hypothetical protein